MNAIDEAALRQATRTMQVISAALMAGIAIFFGMVLFLNPGQQPVRMPIVSIIAAIMFFTNVPLAFILSRVIQENGIRQAAQGRLSFNQGPTSNITLALLGIRQTGRILFCALLEGAAFTGLLGYLVEVEFAVLVVPILVLMLMLITFPTEAGNRAWLTRQMERLEDLSRQSDVATS